MKKTVVLGICLFSVILALGADGVRQEAAAPIKAAPGGQTSPRVQADFGKMPLYFIENKGQMDARVGYYVQGKDKAVYFGNEGLTFALSKAVEKPDKQALPKNGQPPVPPAVTNGTSENERWVVKLDFIGANTGVRPVGEDETGAVISYFQGAKDDWKTGLSTYSRIVYRELWPGIDLVYTGTADRLKAEYIVKPGADPSLIRMAYRGAGSVSLTAEGLLEIATPISSFQDDVPVAWQESAGVRREVAARYALAEPEASDDGGKSFAYGFKLGEYDPTLLLTLDPAVLVYCGFIGGTAHDWAGSIAVDTDGNVYIAGATGSTETSFPVAGGPDLTYQGSQNAFVAKLNPAGTALVYCGYIGGDVGDAGNGIAVDSGRNAYVTGYTYSSETSFPVVGGPDLTYNGGAWDIFVAKVNPAGTALVYCGYIGGDGQDYGAAIAVDGGGNAYVTGYAGSAETSFPVAVGPDLTFNGGAWDAFVAKVNPAGTALVYCGFIGGTEWDYSNAIAVDGAGNAYVTGTAPSPEASFPVVVGPDLTFNGIGDAFVAKVNPAGTALVYCGYIGGNNTEGGYGIAVDGGGNAFVTGYTGSTEASFPVAVGPDLTFNGWSDIFVAKVNPAGTALVYCGYIGGLSLDNGRGIALDGGGNAYVTGLTQSAETSFPVLGGPDLTFKGGPYDAFVAKINPAGSALVYCGYIGGSGYDIAYGIAVDGSGNAFVAGEAGYDGTGFPVVGGPDLTYGGDAYDGFVAKISAVGGMFKLTSPNGGEQWAAGSQHPITWLSGDKAGANKIVYSTDKGATWKEIVFSTPDDESYLWTVPNDISSTVWVRVAERDSTGYDRSDSVFSIVPAATVTVVSPNGGESWLVGTAHTIKWTTTGTVGPVLIAYSIDNGLNWTRIAGEAPNTGSYTWVVPNKPSTKCKVRVRDAAAYLPSDATNGTFTIRTQ